MSLLNWIAFPRKIDKSCLRTMVDKTKYFKVRELKGRSDIPDSYVVYRGDYDDYKELGVWEYQSQFIFKKVFNNQCLYNFGGDFGYSSITKFDDILGKAAVSKEELYYYAALGRYDLTGKTRAKELYRWEEVKRRLVESGVEYIWFAARDRKQLYDLIKLNTFPGEVVEIYTDWVRSSDDRVGPPKEIRIFDIEEVLTSDLFRLGDRLKIEIRNMG